MAKLIQCFRFKNKIKLKKKKRNREKHRMGKTRDLFKKIRNTKGIFHVKMGTIKDRNGMDLNRSRRY